MEKGLSKFILLAILFLYGCKNKVEAPINSKLIAKYIAFEDSISSKLIKNLKNVKEFEAHFLMEMENKLPEVLAAFKKGDLPEDGLNKMVELAKGLMPQYK